MPHTPRLSDADRADLARRHKLVTARVIAAEDIARHLIAKPVAEATRNLVVAVASESSPPSIKRAMFSGVRALSAGLVESVRHSVHSARDYARELATGQAGLDVAGFAAAATALGFAVGPVSTVLLHGTHDHDAAVAHQAGMAVGHRWSSQMLGEFARWRRTSGGSDGLVRAIQVAGFSGDAGPGQGALANLIETQAITHAVDAYADQHALLWRHIAEQVPGTDYYSSNDTGDGSGNGGWGAGLFDVWSAILDRRTCSVCEGLDGEMVRAGEEWPGGRPPAHLRCRCVSLSVWVPEAALKALPQVQLDYGALKADVRDYARGASLDIGEGRRHAQQFMRDAIGGGSVNALSAHLAGRRDYFPNRTQQRAPSLR